MPEPPERNYETPEILSDIPLARAEQKAYFHFDDYAITLARLIAEKKTTTPITIGVSGSWGSGKTTLLRRVQHKLDQTLSLLECDKPSKVDFINPDESPEKQFRVCRTVWFNAWKYTDEDTLLVALVRVIVQAMADDSVVHKIIGKLLDPSYPRRDVVNTVLSWFSIKTPAGDLGLNTGEPQQTPFAEKTALLDLFDEAFDRLMAAWVHHKLDVDKINPEQGVLVVFIDDLDRCLPAKTVQVLEAIKLFMDKPGCVFVLGAAADVVRQAVESHYQNEKVTGQNAADYLEKVIQLRFDLPPVPDSAMQDFLLEQRVADDMLAEWRMLLAAAEVNPRRVKAVLNEIELKWRMLVNSGQAEGVQRADFIRWSALLRAAPEAFKLRIFDIDDLDLRLKFLLDSLRWGSGESDEILARQFQEYEKEGRRLRRVLRKMGAFSPEFDAGTLDAFIYLTAPPSKVVITPGKGVQVQLGGEISFRGELQALSVGEKAWGGIEFVRVPAGKFLMGSKEDKALAAEEERPQHTVDLSQEYWIGKYPVTNAQFAEFVKASGYSTSAETGNSEYTWQHPRGTQSTLEGKEDHPVVQVSWHDAQAYCQWINKVDTEELGNNLAFRLPSEAEWEKAARGEYGNEWPWGNEEPDGTRCNIGGYEGGTTPVGKYTPKGDSPYGAADTAGNVWEWCADWYDAQEYARRAGALVTDPCGPESGAARVVRGGSWLDGRKLARCAYRSGFEPDYFLSPIGFRLVLSPVNHLVSGF